MLGENDGENWILIGPSVAICVSKEFDDDCVFGLIHC